jgi:hypothetical protein
MPSFRRQTWLCSLYGIDWRAKGFTDRSLGHLARARDQDFPCAPGACGCGNAPGSLVVEIPGAEVASVPVIKRCRSCSAIGTMRRDTLLSA